MSASATSFDTVALATLKRSKGESTIDMEDDCTTKNLTGSSSTYSAQNLTATSHTQTATLTASGATDLQSTLSVTGTAGFSAALRANSSVTGNNTVTIDSDGNNTSSYVTLKLQSNHDDVDTKIVLDNHTNGEATISCHEPSANVQEFTFVLNPDTATDTSHMKFELRDNQFLHFTDLGSGGATSATMFVETTFNETIYLDDNVTSIDTLGRQFVVKNSAGAICTLGEATSTINATSSLTLPNADYLTMSTGHVKLAGADCGIMANNASQNLALYDDSASDNVGMLFNFSNNTPTIYPRGSTMAVDFNKLLTTRSDGSALLEVRTSMTEVSNQSTVRLGPHATRSEIFMMQDSATAANSVLRLTCAGDIDIGHIDVDCTFQDFFKIESDKVVVEATSLPIWVDNVSTSTLHSTLEWSGGVNKLVSSATTGELRYNHLKSINGTDAVNVQGLSVTDTSSVTRLQPTTDSELLLRYNEASHYFMCANTNFQFVNDPLGTPTVWAKVDSSGMYADRIQGLTDAEDVRIGDVLINHDGSHPFLASNDNNGTLEVRNKTASDTFDAAAVASFNKDTVTLNPLTTLNLGTSASTVNISSTSNNTVIHGATEIKGDLVVRGNTTQVTTTEIDMTIQDRMIQIATVANAAGENDPTATEWAAREEKDFNAQESVAATYDGAGAKDAMAGLYIITKETNDNYAATSYDHSGDDNLSKSANTEIGAPHKRFAYGNYDLGGDTWDAEAGAWHSSHALVVGYDWNKPGHYAPVDTVGWNSDSTKPRDRSYMYVNNIVGMDVANNGSYAPNFPFDATGIDRTVQRSHTIEIEPFELSYNSTDSLDYYYSHTDANQAKEKGMVFAKGVSTAATPHDWRVGHKMYESGVVKNITLHSNHTYAATDGTDWASGGIVVRVYKFTPNANMSGASPTAVNGLTAENSRASFVYCDLHISGTTAEGTEFSGGSGPTPTEVNRVNRRHNIYTYELPVPTTANPLAFQYTDTEPAEDVDHDGDVIIPVDTATEAATMSVDALKFDTGDTLVFGFVRYAGPIFGISTTATHGLTSLPYGVPGVSASITLQRQTAFERAGGSY